MVSDRLDSKQAKSQAADAEWVKKTESDSGYQEGAVDRNYDRVFSPLVAANLP